MGGFVCASHRRKNKGFPTLKRTLNLGIEKGRLLKNSRPKGGLIQVICYPASPETVDITGFIEKFCIAIRTNGVIGLDHSIFYVHIKKHTLSRSSDKDFRQSLHSSLSKPEDRSLKNAAAATFLILPG